MKTKRQSISKRVRFEVFKRDSFKCQYCGASAPDVVLEVDHIHPVAKDGDQTDIVNLITACKGCNSGKSDKLLSDDAATKKRKRQLDDLQERREQLEMMADWQRGLVDLTALSVQHCAAMWSQIVVGYCLSDAGIQALHEYVLKFGQTEVMEAMRKSARYLRSEGGKLTQESVTVAFGKIGGICVIERRVKNDPELEDIYRIKALLKSRIPTITDRTFMAGIQKLRDAGYTAQQIRSGLLSVEKWWEFEERIDEMLEDRGGE